MANFVLVYTGGSAGSTDAERQKVMQQWGAWFTKLGDKIVDQGNPFTGQAKSVANGTVRDGAVENPPATGYSIVKAGSLNAAADLAKGCPVLLSGGKISVHEIAEM